MACKRCGGKVANTGALPARKCEHCGAVLPNGVPQGQPDFDTLSQLDRFGLGDGEPLFEENRGDR